MKRVIKSFLVLSITCISAFLLMTFVFAEAIKTDLVLARDNISNAITAQIDSVYTNDSYSAFSDGLASIGGLPAIDAMISNVDATQTDVDLMTADCNLILSYLTTTTTFDHVNFLYLQEKTTRDLNPYTLRSISIYNDELDRIQTIIEDPTSGEALISSLESDIESAVLILELLGDKTTLSSQYAYAQTVLNDSSPFIPSSYTSFTEKYVTIDSILLDSINFTLVEVLGNSDASTSEVEAALSALNSALDSLVNKPDLTILSSEYNQALLLDLGLYTQTSSQTFTSGLDMILIVINNPETIQSDVDQALIDISNLYDVLVPLGDNSDLINQINSILSSSYDLYTPYSVNLYLEEVNRILGLADGVDRTSQDISNLTQLLLDSTAILIEKADKSSLIIANNQAIIAYYEDKSSYTDSSYQLFKNAVAQYGNYLSVNAVISDDNALQSDVDDLTAQIRAALAYLEPIVDNSSLEDLYVSKLAVVTNQYTPSSLQAFYDEMDRIYLIIISRELSESMAAVVLNDLENAQSILVYRSDFSELLSLYIELSGVSSEKYSNTSYLNFLDYMMLASSIIMDSNSTQAAIDLCYSNLTLAYDSLQYRPGIIDIKANIESFDITSLITVGNSTIMRYESSDESILSVNENGVIVGKAFGSANVTVTLENGRTETISFLVKANIKTGTLVFAILMPTLSIGLGFIFLFLKPHSFSFIKNIVSKKR